MRMEIQSAVVRMQHRHRACRATQSFVILAEGVHRGPSVADDEFVQHTLMPQSQRTELRRQGNVIIKYSPGTSFCNCLSIQCCDS